MTLNLSNLSLAARKDVQELQQKVDAYYRGDLVEDRFKAYRLTRGVYGQRQVGVQMFRVKIPFGMLTSAQLLRMADISEKYSNGNLHLTTRQNIQLHYVKLADAPAVWVDLEEQGITARESCGNTVRNFTASALAGIDPNEPFDVSPYVQASFEYFLRNPICQDLGRKIKAAFSSSEQDSAFTYFHDFGFIPKVKYENGQEVRGFKVQLAGGLGAQPMQALVAYEFLPENQILPFMEAALRVFDRHGERTKRMKARMKFLLKQIGLEEFLKLVDEERLALKNQVFEIDRNTVPTRYSHARCEAPSVRPNDPVKYADWLKTNVVEQKQQGHYGVFVKVRLGNLHADQLRTVAKLAQLYAADDVRITPNQGLLFRFVQPESLTYLFNRLNEIGLGEPGFGTLRDITACPGTDTCNLAVANSTNLAVELENLLANEYPHLLDERQIQVKISGCMNGCAQHTAAPIGLHGSSIRYGDRVAPAMQFVLGGGVDPDGTGNIADKVIKLPTKRVPNALRLLLDDYETNSGEEEYFNAYFRRQGERYFYTLLKPLADRDDLTDEEFRDWGHEEYFTPEIGVGECAGVSYDMIGAIINDAQGKFSLANAAFAEQAYADSIYHSYSTFIIGAKALLLSKDVACNSQQQMIDSFDEHWVNTGLFSLPTSFADVALQINKYEPSATFAEAFLQEAKAFIAQANAIREQQLAGVTAEKTVINHHYQG